MAEDIQINATPETSVQERPANWEYDIAAECIRKAIDCLKQNDIQGAHFSAKFEGWLEADFWYDNKKPQLKEME